VALKTFGSERIVRRWRKSWGARAAFEGQLFQAATHTAACANVKQGALSFRTPRARPRETRICPRENCDMRPAQRGETGGFCQRVPFVSVFNQGVFHGDFVVLLFFLLVFRVWSRSRLANAIQFSSVFVVLFGGWGTIPGHVLWVCPTTCLGRPRLFRPQE